MEVFFVGVVFGFPFLSVILLVFHSSIAHGFAVGSPPTLLPGRPTIVASASPYDGEDNDTAEQRQECVQAFQDYHVGTWRGIARSFTVTNDKAAGVLRRKTVGPYTTTVSWAEEPPSSSRAGSPLAMIQEQWRMDQKDDDEASGEHNQGLLRQHKREIDVLDCNLDIDSVDASYSLDQWDPDDDDLLPVEWTGLPVSVVRDTVFVVEQCISASSNRRIRCWTLYGGEEKALQRVVVCDEQRVQPAEEEEKPAASPNLPYDPSTLTVRDLFEIQNDVDRLVDKVTGTSTNKAPLPPISPNVTDRLKAAIDRGDGSADDGSFRSLEPNPMTLLELTKPGEVWLGDAVVRDHGHIPMSPIGFDKKLERDRATESSSVFGSWVLGVQKVAWRWSWPSYGPSLVSTVDAGNSLGASGVVVQPAPRAGELVIDESLSRRTAVDDRIVCIDWEDDYVGFWLGGWIGVQIPRYMNFDHTGRLRPFYTELAVVQKGGSEHGEIVCSKLSRIYNYKGQYKQGLSAFYMLQQQEDSG